MIYLYFLSINTSALSKYTSESYSGKRRHRFSTCNYTNGQHRKTTCQMKNRDFQPNKKFKQNSRTKP